jgi:hypothetical protein
VQTIAKFGGAVLVGFLVYLIPIGGRGPGSGGGIGGKEGSGKDAKKETVEKKSPDIDSTKPEEAEPEILWIRVLGGNDVKEDDDHYYRVVRKGKLIGPPLTEKAVRKLIKGRLKNGPPIERIMIQLDEDKSVLETNPVVRDLKKTCRELVGRRKVRTEKMTGNDRPKTTPK